MSSQDSNLLIDNSLKMEDTQPQIGDATDGDESCLLELLPVSCWASLVELLAVRDLLCVSLSSKRIYTLMGSTPGMWSQAACSVLSGGSSNIAHCKGTRGDVHACPAFFKTVTQAGSAASGAPGGSAAADHTWDQISQQLLSAVTAVAHTCLNLKPQLKPQTYLLPPWLRAQPGKVRNLARFDGGALNPALQLTAAQVHWLSWGCMQGHDGGVFVSSCTKSPRTGLPCGSIAVVVINKQVVAELYLPSNCPAPNQWAGILTPPPSISAAAMNDADGTTPATDLHCASNTVSSTSGSQAAAGGAPIAAGDDTVAEHHSLLHDKSGCPASAAMQVCFDAAGTAVDVELWISAAVTLDSATSSAAADTETAVLRRRTSANKAAVQWCHVYAMLMGSIADNAARVRAVRGTAVVPPSTAAAAELELYLAQLVAVRAPVLDVRRLQHIQAAAQAAASNGGQMTHQTHQCTYRHDQQQQQHQHNTAARLPWGALACGAALAASGEARHSAPDDHVNGAGGGTAGLQAAQHQSSPVGSHHLWLAQQQWAAAVAAAQHALASAVAQHESSSSERNLNNDVMAEALAALMRQLPAVAPQVQVLVLPILLPGGRVGVKLPGGYMSAPRLLSLNAPFLMQLRCAWDKLPCLRQVLLMAGPPAQMHQQQQQQCGMRATGRDSQVMPHLQRQQQRQPSTRGLVRGVFSQQYLEQQWQQQQQSQEVWLDGQAVEQPQQQQLGRSAHLHGLALGHRQQQRKPGTPPAAPGSPITATTALLDSVLPSRILPASSIILAEPVVLPGSAFDAIQGMVWSCMDRLAPSGASDA